MANTDDKPVIRVLMYPLLASFGSHESGIRRVVEGWHRHAREQNIVYVEEGQDYDVMAVHAGMIDKVVSDRPYVSHLHGLYFTADYPAASWEWHANRDVIASLRRANAVTVPSAWVAETLQRDMHLDPLVVPHGIDWREWQHDEKNDGYVLWNKNRSEDVCDAEAVGILARALEDVNFITTFAPKDSRGPLLSNVRVTGLLPNADMKQLLQRAGVYLSTAKETFCIGALEAMASGVPVLSWDYGNVPNLVPHKIAGYLAKPGDYADLITGLRYCLEHRDKLSRGGKKLAKGWTWEKVMPILRAVYEQAINEFAREHAADGRPLVHIVIPCYNKAATIAETIESVKAQTLAAFTCIVVDNNSTDNSKDIILQTIHGDARFVYTNCPQQGVAYARNWGATLNTTNAPFLCFLDGDDWIRPLFLEACIPALQKDRTLGIVYTKLYYIKPNGEQGVSPWPDEFNANTQMRGPNQIPTCNVMRSIAFKRAGGYRQRFADEVIGAGAEDAELWMRIIAQGWGAKLATQAALFVYRWQSGLVSGNKQYHPPDYKLLHPYTQDEQYPFACQATPKRQSHPVNQYDQPTVSVIIPVGLGHEKVDVFDALDSVEGQTYRKWEAVVVWDGTKPDALGHAYPFVRNLILDAPHGAGYARNRGAEIARADLLFYLDADDTLYPNAIEKMINAYAQERAIIYSDYVGKAYFDPKAVSDPRYRERILHHDERTGKTVLRHHALDYACERAQKQPDESQYIWCLISALVPKEWHNQICGFDEKMPSWEDWDYWIRMARAGLCFYRLEEPLVVYRFYTGTRRERGREEHANLIQYMREKYQGERVMPCTSCGKHKRQAAQAVTQTAPGVPPATSAAAPLADNNFVLCLYDHPNRGQHIVIGGAVFAEKLPVNTVATGGGHKINYGAHSGGDKFFVHRADIAAQPGIFKPAV